MAHGTAAHHGHHIVSKSILAKVFGGLIALTVLTVITSRLDFGVLNIPLALAIAGTKAALVVLFFMALKYDNKVNALVFAVGSIFVAIFLVFTLFDTAFRGDLTNVEAKTISDMQAEEELLRARDPGVGIPGADTTAADTTAAADSTADSVGASAGSSVEADSADAPAESGQ